jgi:alkaline phosphatase
MSILGTIDTQNPAAIENVRSTLPYPASSANGDVEHSSIEGEVPRFPDYKDADGDGYPENTNRYRLGVGYRTTNHTASSVPLTAEGAGALLFTGYFDQTDIFFKIAHALASDTTALDKALAELSKGRTINTNYGRK